MSSICWKLFFKNAISQRKERAIYLFHVKCRSLDNQYNCILLKLLMWLIMSQNYFLFESWNWFILFFVEKLLWQISQCMALPWVEQDLQCSRDEFLRICESSRLVDCKLNCTIVFWGWLRRHLQLAETSETHITLAVWVGYIYRAWRLNLITAYTNSHSQNTQLGAVFLQNW